MYFRITYNVLIGKKSTKKHKTWDEDGILEVRGTNATLKVRTLLSFYAL